MKEFLKKHKEALLYLFFGGATTAVNIIVYFVATSPLHISPLPANILAWLLSVIFAFVTNKYYVFESKSWKASIAAKEALLFFSSRIASLILDVALLEFLLWIGLNQSILGSEGLIAKIIVNIAVILANYILSKKIVFRKK